MTHTSILSRMTGGLLVALGLAAALPSIEAAAPERFVATAMSIATYPPINFTRKDDGIVLEALCPGLDRESVEVTVVGDVVTIRGQRKPEADAAQGQYQRRERPAGVFARAVSLKERLDPDKADATYQHGILRIALARAPETTPKKIEIRS